MRSGYQTVGFGLYQFLGPAGIGNDYRQAARLRFEDDITKGVGCAGKNKNVCGRICGREFAAPQIAGEKRLGQRFRERL